MSTEITTEAEMQRKAPQSSERPVSARVAAEFLQMHVRSVTRLAGVGHIPGHPIGYGQRKKWLFYISELDIGRELRYAPTPPGVVKAREDKLPRRNRYQFGSLELRKRTKGPDVWLFRYWDRQNPSATRPSITLGTVEDYPTQADARRAAEGLRLEINQGLPLREAVTFQGRSIDT